MGARLECYRLMTCRNNQAISTVTRANRALLSNRLRVESLRLMSAALSSEEVRWLVVRREHHSVLRCCATPTTGRSCATKWFVSSSSRCWRATRTSSQRRDKVSLVLLDKCSSLCGNRAFTIVCVCVCCPAGLKDVLEHERLPKEILQHCLRPILMNLADTKSVACVGCCSL